MNNINNFKIGIIGVGMVGGALNRYFIKKGIKPFLYDKEKELGFVENINLANIVFICVPTPFDNKKGFDLSFVQEACSIVKEKKIVVIKSTVIPGTTETLQKEYPQHKFLFNPEFLTESDVDRDIQYPNRQIVGFTEKSHNIAKEVLEILPPAPFEKIMGSKEAEMVKYFSNTWYAVKVVFANQIYDLCQKAGIDYEEIKKAAMADKMIGENHLEIFHKGYRGYGGKCLLKDIRALIQFADKKGIDLKIHKTTEEINHKLRK